MIPKYGNSKIVQAATALAALMSPSVGMVKRAGKKLADLDYDPDNYVYLRNRAISSLELHGPNQNFDAFEDEELRTKYSTFIGCPISVDHIGTTKIGTVIDSEYIKLSDFRHELDIPLLPVKDTIAVLGEKCSREATFNEVLRYANANKLVRGSDRQQLIEAVGNHLCVGGWVENIWAVEKTAAEEHTRGLVDAILKEAVSDSSMGCFRGDTPILLSSGDEIPISKIKKGMSVITHMGNVGTVKDTFKRHFDKGLYTISVRGLAHTVHATHEHPLYVIRKKQIVCNISSVDSKGKTRCYPTLMTGADIQMEDRFVPELEAGYRKQACEKVACLESYNEEKYTPDFVKVEDLNVGDYVAYSFSDEVRHTDLSPKFFRLLGYYLADGCVCLSKGRPNRVDFTFHKDEKHYITDVVSLCEGLYGKTPSIEVHRVSANAVTMLVCSAKMACDLLYHGGKLAKHKSMSEEILYAPVEHQLELIGSFINGDGFHDKHGALYIESSSKTLVNNCMWLLSRARIVWGHQEQFYPIKPHMCGKSLLGTKELTTWKLRISNHHSHKLQGRTAKYVQMVSKKIKDYSFYYKNHLFFPIKEISFDESWSGDIYNFEVSGDNSYIASNISAHNCLVNQSVCNICGHIATGELPANQDFCDDIRLHKGSAVDVCGIPVVAYELNRDISFFEDSLILPHSYGGKAGGEGADADAKLLEVFASRKKQANKKKAYVGLNNPSQPGGVPTQFDTDAYIMLGDIPDNVAENKEEFNEQRRDFADESESEDITPSDYPEGTIINILFDDGDIDAIVIEETDDGVTVAIEDMDDPVDIPFDDINEVLEYPEELDYESVEDIEAANPEMFPEERAATLNKQLLKRSPR